MAHGVEAFVEHGEELLGYGVLRGGGEGVGYGVEVGAETCGVAHFGA